MEKKRTKRADATKRRYKNAWDESFRYERANWDTGQAIEEGVASDRRSPTSWNTVRRFSRSRSGRTVILAPVFGALGAILYYRRR